MSTETIRNQQHKPDFCQMQGCLSGFRDPADQARTFPAEQEREALEGKRVFQVEATVARRHGRWLRFHVLEELKTSVTEVQ